MIPTVTIFDPPAARPLSKRYRIDPATGALQAGKPPALVNGRAFLSPAASPAGLAAILDATTTQAICLGQPIQPQRNPFPVSSSKDPESIAGAIHRNKTTFTFSNGPGWFLVDFDSLPAVEAHPIANAWSALAYLWPETAHASIVIRPSSSSGLYRCDQPPPGVFPKMHAFVLIDDQQKSPAYLHTLTQRATSIGFPSMIDPYVASPERLVFVAPPRLCPYTYRRTVPTYFSDERPPIGMEGSATTHTYGGYDPSHEQFNKHQLSPDLQNATAWPPELRDEVDNYIMKLVEHLASDIFHAPHGTRARTLFQSGAKLGNLMWTGSRALAAAGQSLLQAAQDAGYDDDHAGSKAIGHLTNGWNHGTNRPFTDIPPLVRWPHRDAILASGLAILEIMRRK